MLEYTQEQVLDLIIVELQSLCGVSVSPDTKVLTNGLLDSMGLIELINSLQSKLDITVNLENLKKDNFDSPFMMAVFIIENSH